LSDHGKKLRINRIFRGPDRNALIVAFDHALFFGPIPGTTDPHEKIRQFAINGADAILMNVGILRKCSDSLIQPSAPGLIIRLDWTSAWDASGGKKAISKLVAHPEEALRHGADAVITYLFVGTGDMEFEAGEIARNAEVARECERLGLPLIIETIARGSEVQNPRSMEWMKLHTRLAVELGADLIKTEYTGDPKSMREVVEISPIPVFVLGGSRKDSDSESLAVVRGAVDAGAAGVVFGRNVFQAENIAKFLGETRTVLDEQKPTPGRNIGRGPYSLR
jgi:class I fructose-bisphosphate aldolase